MTAIALAAWSWWVLAGAAVLAGGLLARTRPAQWVLDLALLGFVRSCLWLRYRIRVRGLAEAAKKGTKGILFLPNHPALIDPIMITAVLRWRFGARPLADENQIDRFFIRWLARRMGALPIPDMAKVGRAGRERIQAALEEIVAALKRGENILLYPSGQLSRGRIEDLRGSSAVETILGELPDVRVVLVRTEGFWGSSFSWASGREPSVSRALRKGLWSLLVSGIFFAPRRRINVELHEPADLPRSGPRAELNRFMEAFYNRQAPPNTLVPYTIWDRRGERAIPEPMARVLRGDPSAVPDATREIVTEYLRDLTGLEQLQDEDELARDLGLDSLAGVDLVAWLDSEFGFARVNIESLRTVGDVMLAACGEAVSMEQVELKPISGRWFAEDPANPRVAIGEGRTIAEVFLNQARRQPRMLIAADQARGERSYRDIVTSVFVLKDVIRKLPGSRVGIMLPASTTADTVFLASLFAEKTPVMVNWTLGPRNVLHCLDLVDCPRIVTAKALIERIAEQGIDLSELSERFVFLEQVARGITLRAKLRAAARSRLGWSALEDAAVPDTAAILFTSGSESLPKAVPLTHENLLTNVQDVISVFKIHVNDRIMGMLPPFHSFGLTTGTVLPMCVGVKVIHHPNPTEGTMLGKVIEAYGATLLLGTPTFLHGIVRASTPEQLAQLRLAVTGAEKCSPRVYQALAETCPHILILEGYGVTECSPIVSVNDENDPRPGTIGKVMPSLEHVVVDVETHQRAATARQGMLLVRGPTVFDGYLQYDGPSPFVDFQGRQWYRTGDLVTEDEDGVLTFRGRLKRFVKLGGEMISLPAIEAVLEPYYQSQETDEGGPVIAVQPTDDEDHPELILFTTARTDRQTVNRQIREAGLSALYNIRRVVRVAEIPTLGTGKTDYRALADMLRNS